jgi:hypothetical protein
VALNGHFAQLARAQFMIGPAPDAGSNGSAAARPVADASAAPATAAIPATAAKTAPKPHARRPRKPI